MSTDLPDHLKDFDGRLLDRYLQGAKEALLYVDSHLAEHPLPDHAAPPVPDPSVDVADDPAGQRGVDQLRAVVGDVRRPQRHPLTEPRRHQRPPQRAALVARSPSTNGRVPSCQTRYPSTRRPARTRSTRPPAVAEVRGRRRPSMGAR